MYRFTLCFIQNQQSLLMLNRAKPPWQGMWNGIGGKIEPGETPDAGIRREVLEETGLKVEPQLKGCVTWGSDETVSGGMYVFIARTEDQLRYEMPQRTADGILEWKQIEWILHPENIGVVSNIPKFLPVMLEQNELYKHHCVYQDYQLISYSREKWHPEELELGR